MRSSALAFAILASALATASACTSSGDPASLPTTTSSVLEPAAAIAACVAALDADPATLGPADHQVVADTTGTEYCLGPTELTGGALEDAFIVDDGRVSGLDLRFSPDGIVAFNLSASRCHDAEPSCPSSRLAIVVGDKVFATPSINSPSFDRDQIRLSGADDPTRLSDLADLVQSSPDTIQFRPVIAEVPVGMSLASIADMLENDG